MRGLSLIFKIVYQYTSIRTFILIKHLFYIRIIIQEHMFVNRKIEHIFVNKCLLFLYEYGTIVTRKNIGGSYGTG